MIQSTGSSLPGNRGMLFLVFASPPYKLKRKQHATVRGFWTLAFAKSRCPLFDFSTEGRWCCYLANVHGRKPEDYNVCSSMFRTRESHRL